MNAPALLMITGGSIVMLLVSVMLMLDKFGRDHAADVALDIAIWVAGATFVLAVAGFGLVIGFGIGSAL
jgi:hypothetical protein